jgi:hypothetical protein
MKWRLMMQVVPVLCAGMALGQEDKAAEQDAQTRALKTAGGECRT